MAAPALRRAGWIAAAALAAAAIVALAVHGQRPDPALVGFTAAGVMADLPPERVAAVVVSRGDRRWEFTRAGEGGWRRTSAPAADADADASVERGLRFLFASAPQRVLAPEELSDTSLAELGLDPPRYAVVVRDAAGARLSIQFGALNPQGLAQYAQVAGHDEVLLLPSFVGEPWAALTGER